MREFLLSFFCLWSGLGCSVEEEENVGKKQMGVDMGLLVIGDRSFVGVTIVQG